MMDLRFGCLVLVLLYGCALSPQIISVSPSLDTAEATRRQTDNTISIRVSDSRPMTVVGSRGGIYRETSTLTTADNMTSNIREALTSAFNGLGYNVASSGGIVLTVNISELLYNIERNNAVNTITTSATVNVTCQNPSNTLNNDYKITDKKDYIKAPSQQENERIINTTLASALNRIFNDTNFLRCLDG